MNIKKNKLFIIYEQPSQHHTFLTPIILDQIKLYKELNDSRINLLIDEKSRKRNSRRDEELKLCDLVICNSTFTKKH